MIGFFYISTTSGTFWEKLIDTVTNYNVIFIPVSTEKVGNFDSFRNVDGKEPPQQTGDHSAEVTSV